MSKAVERLVSRKRAIRDATLSWLEVAARTREAEYMQLSSHTELMPLIKAAQPPDAQVPKGPLLVCCASLYIHQLQLSMVCSSAANQLRELC